MSTSPPAGSTVRAAGQAAWQSILDATRHTPGWLAATAALLLSHATLPAVQVGLIRRLVTALSNSDVSSKQVAAPLIGLTVIVGMNFPLGQVALATAQRMALRLKLHYQSELLLAAARLHPQQLADPSTTVDLAAAERATRSIDSMAGKTLQLISTLVTAATLCIAICTINALAGALVAGAVVPTVVAFTIIARVEALGWPQIASEDRRAAYATEQLLQQRSGTELATFGSGGRIADLAIVHRRRAMLVLDGITRTAVRWELVAAAATALLLGGALVVVASGGARGGDSAAAIAGVISGLAAIRFSGYAFGGAIEAGPRAQAYRRVLAEPPQPPPSHPIDTADAIEATDLTVTYPGNPSPALRGVSLHAERGEIIALVGANGAGKTTAVHALLGIVQPERGQVLINGYDAAGMTITERLAHFGLLTQEFGRYEFTIRDVVSLGTYAVVDDKAIWSALRAARATDFVARLPDGLDTQLGQQWGGVGLSGGQWQRLAMARVCLRAAGIWVLDEPTSAIDAEAEQEVFAELQRTRSERITVVVSHRAWTLKGMDRIYVFEGGRIVQTGSYEKLLAQPGRFAELFAEQVG